MNLYPISYAERRARYEAAIAKAKREEAIFLAIVFSLSIGPLFILALAEAIF